MIVRGQCLEVFLGLSDETKFEHQNTVVEPAEEVVRVD